MSATKITGTTSRSVAPPVAASGGDSRILSSSSKRERRGQDDTMAGLTPRQDSLHVPCNEVRSSARTVPSTTSKEAHLPSGWPTGTSRVAASTCSSVATKGTNGFDAATDSDICVNNSCVSHSSSTHAFIRSFYEHLKKERHYLAFAEEILTGIDDDSSDDED